MCNTGPLAKSCLLWLDMETRKGSKTLRRCNFCFSHPSLTDNSSGKLLYAPAKLNSRFKDGLMNSLYCSSSLLWNRPGSYRTLVLSEMRIPGESRPGGEYEARSRLRWTCSFHALRVRAGSSAVPWQKRSTLACQHCSDCNPSSACNPLDLVYAMGIIVSNNFLQCS